MQKVQSFIGFLIINNNILENILKKTTRMFYDYWILAYISATFILQVFIWNEIIRFQMLQYMHVIYLLSSSTSFCFVQ